MTPTHCRRGHEYTDANAHIDPKGKRFCRVCRRLSRQQFYEDNYRSQGVTLKVATRARDGKILHTKAPASYL